jgi:hypothetical protein
LHSHGKAIKQTEPAAAAFETGRKKLGGSAQIDFRSLRTLHATLMRRTGTRLEVVRDNMGHANVDVTADIHSESRWQERWDAVSSASELITAAQEDEASTKLNAGGENPLPNSETELEPQLEPQPSGASVLA